VHLAAVMLAGKAVRRLVQEAHDQKQQPELRQVQQTFVGEVVVERYVGADLTPIRDEYDRLKQEEQNHGHHGPRAEDQVAQDAVEPIKITIGVPCRKADVGQVHFGCAPGSAAALVSQLLAEGEILFLRCLEPEACFLHVVGELPYLIRSNVGSGFSCKQLGYILIGARAVKEAGQLPLHGLETEEIAFSRCSTAMIFSPSSSSSRTTSSGSSMGGRPARCAFWASPEVRRRGLR